MLNRLLGGRRGPVQLLVAFAILCVVGLTVGSASASNIVIRMVGSTTVNPIAGSTESGFEALYPDTDLQINGTQGSGYGKAQILEGTTEIGMSSSNLSAADACRDSSSPCTNPRAYGLSDVDDWLIARDAISIIVDDDSSMNFLTSITKVQLAYIYEASNHGGVANLYWDTVVPAISGAPHRLVYPRARITTSGTRNSLGDMLGLHKGTPGTNGDGSTNFDYEQQTISDTHMDRRTENADMVSVIRDHPDSIGYVGLGYTEEAGIRVIPVQGVMPSVATVQDGTYPLSRVLHMITLKPAVDPDYTPRIQDYINYMFTADGQQMVENAGFVSIAPNWDINVDHHGNISDVVSIGLHWGQSGARRWIRADANSDGGCNISDVVLVGLHWNGTW